MRSSVTSLSKKLISTFFAATLALGLVPAAAFAADDSDAVAPQNSEAADAASIETDNDVISSEVEKSAPIEQNEGEALTDSFREDTTMDDATGSEDAIAIPAATQRVNEDVALTTRTVAQAESTRSYFLAQTLESTRTVPIVSANLPLDTSAVGDVIEPGAASEDPASEEEGDAEGDDPDSEGDPADGVISTEASDSGRSGEISAASTVIGSFTYRGITYAVEPGGESVAVVAADYSKLPEEFIENQVIVLPSMVTADGLNIYSVTRIADNAFANVKPQENEEGITAITIPASVTEIGDDAFSGFDTLQYVVVSEDNPNYSQYDGCLYDADQTCLLLIPEGRLGAVRIASSVTEIDPEVFSHCPSVDTLVADADSAAYQLLSESDFRYGLGEKLLANYVTKGELEIASSFSVAYSETLTFLTESASNLIAVLDELRDARGASAVVMSCNYETDHIDQTLLSAHEAMLCFSAGSKEVVRVVFQPSEDSFGTFTLRDNKDAYVETPLSTIHSRTDFLSTYSDPERNFIFWDNTVYTTFYKRNPYTQNDSNWTREPPYPWGAHWGRVYFNGSRLLCPDWDVMDPDVNFGLSASGKQTSGVKKVEVYDSSSRTFLEVPAKKYVTDILNTGEPYYIFLNGFRPAFLTGYMFNWNVSTFGGATASVGRRIEEVDNSYTVSENGRDGQEFVGIQTHLDDSEAPGDLGYVQFPKQSNLENGARFLGWTNKADGSEPTGGYFKYEDGIYTVNASGLNREGRVFDLDMSETTWYAVWRTDIIWDMSEYGGQGIQEQNNVLNNTASAPPVVDENRGEGWTFRGWATKDEDGILGTPNATAPLIPDGLTTFYAVWGVDVGWRIDQSDGGPVDDSVAFTSPSAAGGTSWSQSDILYGTAPVETWPSVSDREGYLFAGWKSSADDHVYGAGDAVPAVTAPTTFTTVWSAGESRVTFDANLTGHESMNKTETIFYDDDMPAIPTGGARGDLDGYVFAGYFDKAGKQYYGSNGEPVVSKWDKADEEVTLYAHWKYKVFFDKNDDEAKASLPAGEAQADGTVKVTLTGGTGSESVFIHDYDSDSPWIWATYHGKEQEPTAKYPTVYLPVATRANYPGDGGAGKFTTLSQWTYDNGSKSVAAGVQLEKQNALIDSLTMGLDGIKSVTLTADWAGVATKYTVRLVASTSFPGGAGADAIEAVRITNDSARTKTVTGVPYGSLLSAGTPDTSYEGEWKIVVPVPEGSQHVRFAGYYGKPNATSSDFRYIDADGTVNASNRVLDRSTLVGGAIELYAKWEVADYTVSFVLSDADANQDAKTPDDIVDIRYGDDMPALRWNGSTSTADKVPTRAGYEFRGYFDKNGIQYYDDSLNKISDDITWQSAYDVNELYARWTYAVVLDMNLGSGARAADAVTAKDGTTLKAQDAGSQTYGITATERTKSNALDKFSFADDATKTNVVPTDLSRTRAGKATGYEFVGFTTARGDKATLIDAAWLADAAKNPSALLPKNGTSVTIYALWEPLSYDVVLDHTGGDTSLKGSDFATDEDGKPVTGTAKLEGVVYDGIVLEQGTTLPAPHRLGYEFKGYFSEPDGEGALYLTPAADGTMTATTAPWEGTDETPVLYAHYEQIDYRIDFVVVSPDPVNRVEPAEVESVNPVHYGDPLANFSSAARKLACTGYAFKGWQNADGTLMFDDAGAGLGTFAFERTITLSPVWEAKKIDVVWNPNWPAGSGSAPVAVTTSESFGQAFKGGAAPRVPFGYEFLGWFRDANDAATKVDVSEGATFRPASTDANPVVYFARWRAVPYKVTLLSGERASYDTKFGLEAEVKDRGNGDYRWEHTYTVAQGDWAFAQPRMLPGYTFAGWEQVRSVVAEDGTVTWEVVVASAPAYVNASSFEREADLTFRAKGTATISKVTLDLNGADPSALGANPDTYDYAIGTPVTLPSALKWSGHTFLGWELTKRGSQTVAPSGKPSTEVTVVADPKATPQPLVYQAQWKDDEYAISFVLSPVNSTPIADKVTGLGRTTEFAFPQPTFRGGFPVPAEGYAEGATVASDNASRIFMGYRIVTNAEAGTTAMFYPNDPASPKTVDELLKRYPGIRDTDGNEPRYGSVIEFHGVWETGYHVDVPLVVNMRFDPERVEESLQVGEAALCITAPDSTTRVDVVGLVCDPVAASSTAPGTVGAFDDRATCGNAYLTLWARRHSKQDESLPKGEAVEFNLGTVADESGVPLQSAAVMVDGQQTVRGLPELGFSFGGTTPEDRTLDLMFGLRFADGFDASTLTYLTDRSFQDTGKSVPIARVYYTLALAR